MFVLSKKMLSSNPVAVLAIFISFSGFWMLRNLSQPWNGLDGFNGAHYSAIARNYLRYGPVNLRFGQATNFEFVSNLRDLEFNQHHPPLLPLLITGAFYVAGENEATARLIPILATFGSILLVYALTVTGYGPRLALVATGIFASLPGVLFFARMPGFEALTLFLVLLVIWFYARVVEAPKPTSFLGLYIALAAALLADWPAYFLAPLIPLHCWFFRGNLSTHKSIVFGIPLLSALILVLFQLQSFWVDPSSFADLINQGMSYMGLMSKQSHLIISRFPEVEITFTLSEFVVRVLSRLDLLFSYPVLILALLGLTRIWQTRTPSEGLVLISLGVGLAYCVVFYRSVFIHYWHTYYLSAPIAILAALGVRRIVNREGGDELTGGVSNRTALIFLAVLVVWGMFPRLWLMHQIQTRLLPGNKTEQATFLKDVGLKLRSMSQTNDVILTNLPFKARKEIGYYSTRKIVWQVDSIDVLKEQLKLMKPNTQVHFFYWLPENNSDQAIRIYEDLKNSGIARSTPIDGHQFTWFNLVKRSE